MASIWSTMAAFLRSVTLVALAAHAVSGTAVLKFREDVFGVDAWHNYVRSPSDSLLNPRKILSANTTGNVTNPDGLLGGNGLPTILTRNEEDTSIPTLLVDFGQNVVGIVTVTFAGSSNSSEGLPGLKLAFSETQQYLTNVSDFTRSDNMATVS